MYYPFEICKVLHVLELEVKQYFHSIFHMPICMWGGVAFYRNSLMSIRPISDVGSKSCNASIQYSTQ